jgi:hypothetical protein
MKFDSRMVESILLANDPGIQEKRRHEEYMIKLKRVSEMCGTKCECVNQMELALAGAPKHIIESNIPVIYWQLSKYKPLQL